jgi:hypothetical protein
MEQAKRVWNPGGIRNGSDFENDASIVAAHMLALRMQRYIPRRFRPDQIASGSSMVSLLDSVNHLYLGSRQMVKG